MLFAFDLTYSGVFRVHNIPQDQLHPVVMIECPRLLFPFARQIVADAVRNGGFPPLFIDPIDFVGLYRQKAMEAQQAPGGRRRPARQPGGLTGAAPLRQKEALPVSSVPPRYARQSASAPSVATKARCASRSASVSRTMIARGVRAAIAAARLQRRRRGADVHEAEIRLLAADQLDIDLGQDLGVEQRAVLGSARIVDAIARAQRIEVVGCAWMFSARQRQGVEGAGRIERRRADAGEFRVQKADVEAGVVRHEPRIAEELREARRRSPRTRGLSARKASVRPWTANAPWDMARSGLR